ncbi:MAG: L,D-transpeptidase family protein [Caldimicrobium sp.]
MIFVDPYGLIEIESPMKLYVLTFIFGVFILLVFFSQVLKAEEIYYLIDKATYKLQVKKSEEVIFETKIGYGLKSELSKRKKGDFLTPEGKYEITEIRPSKQYLYFIKLNYPNFNDLTYAYFRGDIDFQALRKCKEERKCHNEKIKEVLGSEIGLHGGGAFKKEREGENYHWTQGCIALNNKDLENFLKWVKPNQKVFIIDSSKPLFEILKKLAYPNIVKPSEFWEGSLYLKVNDITFWYFRIIENTKGQKYLEWKEWIRGALTQEKIALVEGGFDKALENRLKEVLIRGINQILNPFEERDVSEWR